MNNCKGGEIMQNKREKRTCSIMVQGTGSGVGKSVIVSALCRILNDDGYSVAPFKSQNMALNSFVTRAGGEIGRAQAVQARAARIEPTVDMNPVLIKPTRDRAAQIILMGKPIENMSVYEYKNYKSTIFSQIENAYKRLAQRFDAVVIEGAGSPAEVNLKEHDLANMKIAEMADAPVILVGDIDRGGVFAWLIGTLQLLEPPERARVKGIIINKFRGDKRLLRSGLTFLEKKTGIKVLGVIPYFHKINVPEEDGVPFDSITKENFDSPTKKDVLKVAVVYLPHISNFDDFDAIKNESSVKLDFVRKAADLEGADFIIIPGTKNTIDDLNYLKKNGFSKKISAIADSETSVTIMGICGGYQMLGSAIYDELGIESKEKMKEGLKLLPVVTALGRNKILRQVKGRDFKYGIPVAGYEIHHGLTRLSADNRPFLRIERDNGVFYDDGCVSSDGRIIGTYIHGLFNSNTFRHKFLNAVRRRAGWAVKSKEKHIYNLDKELDKWSNIVRKNIDLPFFYEILKKT